MQPALRSKLKNNFNICLNQGEINGLVERIFKAPAILYFVHTGASLAASVAPMSLSICHHDLQQPRIND